MNCHNLLIFESLNLEPVTSWLCHSKMLKEEKAWRTDLSCGMTFKLLGHLLLEGRIEKKEK